MEEVKIKEIETFIHNHIQSKIDHNELGLAGFNMEDKNIFESQLDMYEHGMFEGLINGIIWTGGTVEGIETDNEDCIENFKIGDKVKNLIVL